MDNFLRMKTGARNRALAAIVFGALGIVGDCAAQPAPSHPLDAALHEQVVMLPAGSGLAAVDLQTTIFKPPGDGPFPLLVHAAYTASGAKAHLVAYGAFKNDSHGMSSSRDGLAIGWPETEKFLKQVGLPTEPRYSVSNAPAYARTDFARIDDVDAIPHVRDTGREGYRKFLEKPVPRAFAISPTGAWGYAVDGDDPALRALANCQKNSKAPCQLYAVDDTIVWKDLL